MSRILTMTIACILCACSCATQRIEKVLSVMGTRVKFKNVLPLKGRQDGAKL